MAALCARTAAGSCSAHRHAHQSACGRSGNASPCRSIPAGAAGIRLVYRPQPAHRFTVRTRCARARPEQPWGHCNRQAAPCQSCSRAAAAPATTPRNPAVSCQSAGFVDSIVAAQTSSSIAGWTWPAAWLVAVVQCRRRAVAFRPLLLVRDACRDVIELLATRRCHDDCAADVHTMVADAGIWLKGEYHARLQHGLTLARSIGADEGHIEICLLLIDLGAA